MESIIQTSAPGKLILIGEYAVLEQAPCLVSAVQKFCTIRLEPNKKGEFRIESSRKNIPSLAYRLNEDGAIRFHNELPSDDYERLRFVLHTLDYVRQQAGKQLTPATIHINTDAFFHRPSGQKLGLGASAAITVSLLAALMEYCDQPLDNDELFRQAYAIHRTAQDGVGSGMDIAASSVGGILQYKIQSDNTSEVSFQTVQWPEALRILPVWAGRSASTQDMVRRVQAFRDTSPSSYDAIMQPMMQLSKEGCQTFVAGDITGFLEVIADFAKQEQKLGEASQTAIMSEAHREIGAIIQKAGGSYKPSGAGGGDIGVAFCDSSDVYERMSHAIKNSRFDRLDLRLQTSEALAKKIGGAD